MLDINVLRQEPEKVKKAVAAKSADPKLVDAFLVLDEKWRAATGALDELRARQNKLSKERNVEAARENKERVKAKEQEVEALEKEREAVLYQIPNLPSEDTPAGKDESGNKILRKWGELPEFDFEPKDHAELGERLGIIDIESASKVSGTRFGYLKGTAAILEFALVQFALDVLTDEKILKKLADKVKKGYSAKPFVPVVPPVMIRPEVLRKMARLDPKEERYYIPSDDLYLAGSAEHALGPLHMDEVIPEEQLPIRYVGFSTSFRREAGSYGRDTRGILRVHQFDKVEMESFTLPEDSLAEQEFIVSIQEYLMQQLLIPHQVVLMCTGDMGGPDVRQIDIEAWMPGQMNEDGSRGRYRETHTSDFMGDYQARRLNTRFRRSDIGNQISEVRHQRSEYAHMNDATAFAVGRTIIAIMENNQTEEGRIEIPKILYSYGAPKVIG